MVRYIMRDSIIGSKCNPREDSLCLLKLLKPPFLLVDSIVE